MSRKEKKKRIKHILLCCALLLGIYYLLPLIGMAMDGRKGEVFLSTGLIHLLFPLYLLVRLWQATIRMRASDAKSLENLEDKKRLIGLAWHNRIFFLPMCKYIFRPNFPMSGLVSASRDGAWLCAFFKFLGIGTVRGSSKRRGAHAIISMVETLQHTSDIFITPDGPRGPRYVCKPGFLSVAKSSGARILLLRITPSSFWTIKEVFEQEERVKKGWFPKNPKRTYKF